MRFVLAMMKHETNTFSPVPTSLASFAVGRASGVPAEGDEVIAAYAGTNTGIAAYLDLAREVGAEVSVPLAANAAPAVRSRMRRSNT